MTMYLVLHPNNKMKLFHSKVELDDYMHRYLKKHGVKETKKLRLYHLEKVDLKIEKKKGGGKR